MWNRTAPSGLAGRGGTRGRLVAVLAAIVLGLATILPTAAPRAAMAQDSGSGTSAAPALISEPVSTSTVVDVPDPNLRAALETELGKSDGESITVGDMASLTSFAATGTRILSIRGLEHATNVTKLSLYENSIWDLTPLAGLDNLEVLELWENIITSVEPLRGLESLYELHLGGNAITDVEPLLDVPNLQILHLWSNDLDDEDLAVLSRMTGLTELFLSGASITEVGPLARLTNLESLHVTRSSVSDVSPLAGLSNMTELVLNWGSVADISPLAHLSNLETLELWNNEIEDFSPLEVLTGLKELDVSDNKLTGDDLVLIGGLTQLERLDVGKYYSDPETYVLTDIGPLANLVNLTELHVEGQDISDLSPVSGLTGLKELHFYRNEIEDLSPIAGLVNLEEIALGENPISDLSPLSGADLGKLERLYMWNCEIDDLSPLSDLTSIKLLHLYGNEVVDISPLAGLADMEELHLERNVISDVSPLADLQNLTLLHIYLNEIEDLSPLAGLTKLENLHIYGNRVSDVSSLAGLTSLKELHLGLNSITDVSPLSGLTDLELLHIFGNDIEDLSPLLVNEGLDSGDSLNVSGNPLSEESLTAHVGELRSRGVRVAYVPAPNAPSELSTRAWGADTVELSWEPDASATTARTTGYRVEWSPTGDGEWTELIDDTGSTGTTYFDTGLSAETTRYYRVAALSAIGDSFPSEAAAGTTRPTEVEAEVATDARTVVHVGRTALAFAAGSWDGEFGVRASSDVENCGEPGEAGAAPGAVIECVRVEIIGGNGESVERAGLLRPMDLRVELSPVLIEESGGLAELYRHYLNGDLRLLARGAPGEHWREHAFSFRVGSARPVTASVRLSSAGDFALVYPGSATQ